MVKRSNAEGNDLGEASMLSKRGKRALCTPPLGMAWPASSNPLDDKQGGLLDLAVAENKLSQDILGKRAALAFGNISTRSFSYNPWTGTPSLRNTIAAFMREHFCKDNNASEVYRKGPTADEIVCLAGASAVLAHVSFCLCDPGDVCLVPSPYNWAYDMNLIPLAGLKLMKVPLVPSHGYALTPDSLDMACKQAETETGRFPKMVLLTNPNNPLGRVARRTELEAVVDWCERHSIHLVVDEICALSSFEKPSKDEEDTQTEFVAMGELLRGKLGPRRHVVWAVSKDFGAAGWRAGVLWTQNRGLLNTFARNMAKFASLSGPVQSAVEQVLADRKFVASYLQENRKRLAASCNIALKALKEMELPFFEPDTGICIWCDCRSLMPKVTKQDQTSRDAELLLHKTLCQDAGIAMTPGMASHHPEPGWFRLCYAAVDPGDLDRGMQRLKDWVTSLRTA